MTDTTEPTETPLPAGLHNPATILAVARTIGVHRIRQGDIGTFGPRTAAPELHAAWDTMDEAIRLVDRHRTHTLNPQLNTEQLEPESNQLGRILRTIAHELDDTRPGDETAVNTACGRLLALANTLDPDHQAAMSRLADIDDELTT